jgi:AraC-like DNA-binding protein
MLEKCKSFISENFKNNITLQQMADCAGMTKFHFNRAFKLATGYTPYRYLLLQRLYYAELLLKNTKKPISEIAIASGFNSLENFSAVFATYHGKSPSLYKKEGKD